MAKTESTAVNELIDLVQSNKPLSMEPADDLFSTPTSINVQQQPARMTAPLPAMRGEVAPLPPRRAPNGTASHQHLQIRVTTAPEHGDPIPPIANVRTTQSVSAVPPPRPRAPSPSPSMPPLPRMTTQSPVAPPIPRTAQSMPAVAPPIPRTPQAMPAVKVTSSSPTLPSPRTTMPSMPPAKPSLPTVEMPRASKASLPPPRVTPRSTQPPPVMPVVAPFEPTASAQAFSIDDAVPISTETTDDWGAPPRVAKHDATVQVASARDTIALVKKLIAPTIILAIIGVMIGGFFAFDGQGGKKKAAPSAPAIVAEQPADAEQPAARPPIAPSENAGTASVDGDQPQPPTKAEGTPPPEVAAEAAKELAPATPSAAPIAAVETPAAAVETPAAIPNVARDSDPAPVREVKTAKGVVKLVDVRIDSKPAGATVMLVDNGKTSFLGTTPVATSLDAGRAYDVIFTLEGRPTSMAHLDPSKESRLAVSLGRSSSAKKERTSQKIAEPAFDLGSVVEKPAKTEAKATAKAEPKTTAKADEEKDEKIEEKAEPKTETKTAAKAVAKAEKAVASTGVGEGTLMVSSKPPCQIYIDGKATGLTTPQRSITLPAGTHKVTFVNAAEKITKTVPVTITADQSTKLIQDLMKK